MTNTSPKHSLVALLVFSTSLLCSSAHASPDTRDVVRTQTGRIVVNSFGNCVRTQWETGTDACGPVVAQKVVRRHPIAQEERTIYFGFNKAALTPDSQHKLDSLATVLKSEEDVKSAHIVGYADRIGSPSYNEALSKKRALVVKNYIVGRGYANASVAETRWLGETAPVTNCPASLNRQQLIDCLQKDRRVEVEIDYTPEPQASGQR